MNTENLTVETTETIQVRTRTKRSASRGGLTLTAIVTDIDGHVSSVDEINVTDETDTLVFSGYASPNIGGNFHKQGREAEAVELVSAFITEINNND